VSSNDKNIPNSVQNEDGTRFRVKFIPQQVTIHHVHVKFNGMDIPGKRRCLLLLFRRRPIVRIDRYR
jgi:hypothetical protein